VQRLPRLVGGRSLAADRHRASEADIGAEPFVAEQRGLEVKLRSFVGATDSIELQILPKGSYI